jgi:hypothetical protein
MRPFALEITAGDFVFCGGSSPYRHRPFIRHVRQIGVSLTQQANVGRSGSVPKQEGSAVTPGSACDRLRSITFERPPSGLGDPDTADSLPASPNLVLCYLQVRHR